MTNPERILVVGATGSIGRLVTDRLAQLGYPVRALTRDVDRARRVLGSDVELASGDLADPQSLTGALEGIDSIVMTHGAPYGSNDYEAVDYGAVPAVLDALAGRQAHVVLMSSIGVTESGGSSRDLLNWKRRGERLLRASSLPYTIVRPAWFEAGSGTEQRIDLQQGDRSGYGPVRREHVAETLVQAVLSPDAASRTLEVYSTNGAQLTDWNQAFAALAPDQPDALDGVRDRPGLPLDREPQLVRDDLKRWRSHS